MSELCDEGKTAYLTVKSRMPPAQTIQPVPAYTMRVHTKAVSAVAFFKDDQRVVTGSWDRTLQIWDVKKRTLVGGPFEGHSDDVISVAVSPDDKRIASGGDDGVIIIWDVDSKQMVLKPLEEHTDRVRSVCFSPDGKRLASGSYDERVIVWDAETGVVLSKFQGNLGGVCCVAFSPDGLKLASGGYCTVRVWYTDNAELLFDIDAHHHYVRSVVWTPDGQQLVSASADTTVKFWDSSNGDQIGQPCTGHTSYIRSLAISSDGSFIATASYDMTVRLWSTESYRQIGHPLEHTARVYCVAISLSGELLASGDCDGNLQLWSIENTLSATLGMDSSYFAHRSKVKLGQNLYAEALSDANKVIEVNPSSHLGYELKHAALRGVHRHDDASEALTIMLSKLDDAPDPQIRQLRQQYVSPSEVKDAFQRAIHAQLENAPLRLINTITGHICDRNAQINAFTESTEYKELLHSFDMYAPLQTELIKEAVIKCFSWVMLSHRWEREEPVLHDIHGRDIYDLDPVGTVVKLQKFCKVARDAGYRWAWVDTCCIDQNNNVEVQQSVNSMFNWYHYSALTIVYLSDVIPSSKSGALANSVWNKRGWTVQEFLAPKIILFYQADWTLYLDDRSRNHKESVAIMQELERSTGINTRTLVTFRPGMRDAREKLRWASTRVTTLQEDIAYSLFGVFGVHLPVIYGEKRQNALGRLLQEIIAHSGDITALDWVGQSSNFNSCLPAEISSYKAPPYTPPSLSEHDMQDLNSTLRNKVTVQLASKLYTTLENLSVPRFANARLQLPCIAFPLIEVRWRPSQDGARCSTYSIRADGLQDLLVTTDDKLVQFSPARRIRQTFLLIRPWTRYDLDPDLVDFTDESQNYDPDLDLVDFTDESQSVEDWADEPGDDELVTRGLRLLVRLARPFGALLLAQQRGGEYKRIASDSNIIAQVTDITTVDNLMNTRTLEIL
jgi:WD40 repeat protein